MNKDLSPTELEFRAYTELLIGIAVINIADGKDAHIEIQDVIIKVLKWIHSKETFNG